MGFSYMKSKLKIINGYGNLCLNKPLCGQISSGKAINLLRLSHCLHSPFNLAIQVTRFRTLSSVACLYGLQQINASLLLCTGRRFIHSNRSLVTVPNRALIIVQDRARSLITIPSRALITVRNRALVTVPYRRLAGQLARRAARSPCWRWLRNRKYGFIDFCIVFTILFGSWQWVPYSNRLHLVLSSDRIENFIGELQLQRLVKEEKSKILPPTSPESVRVQAILRDIVQAMHDNLGLQRGCHVSVHVPDSSTDQSMLKAIGSLLFYRNKDMGSHSQPPGALLVSRLGDPKRHVSTSRVGTKREFIDSTEEIAQITPKKARKLGLKYGTKHLERLNWEVMVVDSYCENAMYLPNGKIVFYTGFLKGRRFTDAEIATILAHEVGHGVGRHESESLMRTLWYIAIVPLIFPIPQPFIAQKKLTEIIFNFFGRRRELEADYIGMLLMAAAGYDPRAAPKVYRTIGSDKENMSSTHPSGKRREEKLNRKKVMKQAVEIYVQSKADQRFRI